MINPKLIKTIPMHNEIGICLPNSVIRCVLNSEKLSLQVIESTTDILGDSPKKFYEKYKENLFDHMRGMKYKMFLLLGMYCEIYLSTHHIEEDIVERILFISITKQETENRYKQAKTRENVFPESHDFYKQIDIGVIFRFPTIMRNDDVLVATHEYRPLLDMHICTDMILQKKKIGDSKFQHVVFYNVLENIMQDNDTLFYVPCNDLFASDHTKQMRINLSDKTKTEPMKNIVFDGYEYIPELLHFQNMRGYKTKICEFLTQSPTLANHLKRLSFLMDYVNKSTFPYKYDLTSYVNTLKQVQHFYSCNSKGMLKEYLNAMGCIDGYSYLEIYVRSDGIRLKSSKLLEQLYDTLE